MNLTNHAATRCQQRAIRQDALEAALEFGEPINQRGGYTGFYLSRKAVKAAKEYQVDLSAWTGLFVVLENAGWVVTTFKTMSHPKRDKSKPDRSAFYEEDRSLRIKATRVFPQAAKKHKQDLLDECLTPTGTPCRTYPASDIVNVDLRVDFEPSSFSTVPTIPDQPRAKKMSPSDVRRQEAWLKKLQDKKDKGEWIQKQPDSLVA